MGEFLDLYNSYSPQKVAMSTIDNMGADVEGVVKLDDMAYKWWEGGRPDVESISKFRRAVCQRASSNLPAL